MWKRKSFLVETVTIRTILREGTKEEPKFELGTLEIIVQLIIERNQKFFYRLSHQAEDQTISVVKVILHNQSGKTPRLLQECKNRKEDAGKLNDTLSWKVI